MVDIFERVHVTRFCLGPMDTGRSKLENGSSFDGKKRANLCNVLKTAQNVKNNHFSDANCHMYDELINFTGVKNVIFLLCTFFL